MANRHMIYKDNHKQLILIETTYFDLYHLYYLLDKINPVMPGGNKKATHT